VPLEAWPKSSPSDQQAHERARRSMPKHDSFFPLGPRKLFDCQRPL